MAIADRLAIAEAACTVWQAYFNAGSPDIVNNDAGGWTQWNRLCRQVVLWLAQQGLTDALPWPELGDPATSMLRDAAEHDPEIEALGDMLRCLHALSSDTQSFTAADMAEWVAAGEHLKTETEGQLRSAVTDIMGRAELSARSLGRVLRYRRDRAVSGLKLQCTQRPGYSAAWRVVMSQQQ